MRSKGGGEACRSRRSLVVGLGNPGERYHLTPHNIGFLALDAWAGKFNLGAWRESQKFNSHMLQVVRHGARAWLMKPQTYMNLSGQAVSGAARYYGIKSERVLVVQDDLDLPLWHVRYYKGGSAGGHNGVRSVYEALGVAQDTAKGGIVRLRLGVKPVQSGDAAEYVLKNFSKKHLETLPRFLERVALGLECFFEKGFKEAQQQFNGNFF